MRRLIRHLFALCSAASLLLCAALCVLWAASYSHPGAWAGGRQPGVRWEARSADGWVVVERREVRFLPDFGSGKFWSIPGGQPHTSGAETRGGFYLSRHHGLLRPRLPGEDRPPDLPMLDANLPEQPWYYQTRVGVAHPLACLAAAVLPALWLWRRHH